MDLNSAGIQRKFSVFVQVPPVQDSGKERRGHEGFSSHLLDDFALVMPSSKIIKVNNLLDVVLHVHHHLELHIRLQQSSRNLI